MLLSVIFHGLEVKNARTKEGKGKNKAASEEGVTKSKELSAFHGSSTAQRSILYDTSSIRGFSKST
jgi:hypothetical protein